MMRSRDEDAARIERRYSRRGVLGGLGLAGAVALAGCIGGEATGNDDDEDGTTSGNSGGAGNGQGAIGGVDRSGGIGASLTGELASLMVEYVQPVEEVLDFSEMPNTDEDGSYGTPQTVDHWAGRGLAKSGESFYGVGLAIENVSDFYIDVGTVLLMGQDTAEFGAFPGRSQRLSFQLQGRGSGAVLSPGEVVRGELVFALGAEPATYSLVFDPRHILTGATERFEVDLASGTDGTASFSQNADLATMGQQTTVGDFDVTLHDVSFAETVADSPYQDLFGERPGYRYVVFDLSATRTSDEMIGQDWSLGVVDADGYNFSWRRIYQDALELNRTRLEDLAVGESIDHTLLAFPLSTEFEPAFVTMMATGPFDPPTAYSADVGTHRTVWSLS